MCLWFTVELVCFWPTVVFFGGDCIGLMFFWFSLLRYPSFSNSGCCFLNMPLRVYINEAESHVQFVLQLMTEMSVSRCPKYTMVWMVQNMKWSGKGEAEF